MFNSSKETNKTNLIKKAEDKETHDFVTHNMPSPSQFSGQTFSSEKTVKSDMAISTSGPEAHHKIGFLIISIGLILIIALFYFGYSYFIKPLIQKPEAAITATTTTSKETNITENKVPENILPIEVIATSTPEISTSTTETASSSDIIMPEETPVVATSTSVSTIDSDADGLTDNEEKIVGTDPNSADTDDDGYLDIAELKSGYDPLLPGQKVNDNSQMLGYKIDTKASVIYPATWEVTKSDINNTVIFADSDKAFIQVTYQDNPGKIKPAAWFEQQFSGAMPGAEISGDYWQGFYSQDGLAAYVFNKDLSKIYNFSCSPLTSDTTSITLFNLMIKTLLIK